MTSQEVKRPRGRPRKTVVHTKATCFGARLTRQRRTRRLSQREVAERSGISVRSLRRYELGQRLPSIAICARLAKAMRARIEIADYI